MPYGVIKVDQVTFTNAGVDQTISVSGIVASISGNITATGTISGNVIRGGTTVSGATVTGTAGQFGTITGNTAGFTTVTGTTVTGTTANFATVSGTTITGTTLTVASGTFTGNSTAAAFIPTGSTVPTDGVYLPAANTVGVATNGTGRLFVNASGNIGIANASVQSLGGGYSTLEIKGKSGGYGGGIILSPSDASTAPALWYYDGNCTFGSNTSTPVVFLTGGTEKVRITSAGLVGVGTSSPQSALDIASGTFQSVRTYLSSVTDTFHQYRGTPDGTGYEHARVFSGRDTSVHTYGSYLALYTEGKASGTTDTSAERLRIDSSGNLGVGVTSPATASFGNVIRNKAPSGTGAAGYFSEGANSDTWFGVYSGTGTSDSAALIYPSTGSLRIATSTGVGVGGFSEKIRITSAGLVGVGTSSVSSKLHIQDAHTLTADTQIALIENTTTGEPASLAFLAKADSGSSGNKGAIYFDAGAGGGTADNKLQFTAQHQDTITPAMTLDGSGRLGIGTTSPGSLLEVNGKTVVGSTSSSALEVFSNGDTEIGFSYSTRGNIYAKIIGDVTVASPLAGELAFQTATGGSLFERARIDSSGRLLVGTSTTTSQGQLLRISKASTGTEGAGIDFIGAYSLADDASQTINITHGALLMITQNSTGQGGLLFATYVSATIIIVADPSGIFATSDTDTKLCVFKSANTAAITVKNRLGATHDIGIAKLTNI